MRVDVLNFPFLLSPQPAPSPPSLLFGLVSRMTSPSSSFSSLPLVSPSVPLTSLAHALPSASSTSTSVSSYPPLPASRPSTPSASSSPPPPPPPSTTTTSFAGYTPLNDPPLPKSSKAKGKARAVQQSDGWVDLERGGQHGAGTGSREEEDEEGDRMVQSGWERIQELTVSEDQARSYPPMTEDEREEKRIGDVSPPTTF